MSEIILTDSDMADLRAIFFSQAEEIRENLPRYIIAIEENPDEENWGALKRAFHTLKGDSKAIGFNSLSTFAHKVEDLIAELKDKGPDRSSIDLLFECSDAYEVFLDKLARGAEPDISDIVSKIESHTGGRISMNRRDDMPKRSKTITRSLPFLRIEPERVDMIMDLVGELVIGRSMLSRITSEMDGLNKDTIAEGLEGLNSSFERTLSDLQRSVMKVRMLPVDLIFRRFPRIVRDLSIEKGKIVRLKIEGENTELDKGIVDVIGEPLLHLIRNAIDHGIETPEERKASGKLEEGLLSLKAFHQGNQMVLEVEDDGRGIDTDRLKEKAIQMGIISHDEPEKMSDKDAMDLIFQAEFSTSETITEISGRGIGMNIVKDVVESLRGIIEITSEKGKGTKFTLRLPFTLAIIKSILFAYKKEIFALPLISVTEIIRLLPEDVDTMSGYPVLRHRDGIVPLLSIDGAAINNSKIYVILIGVANMKAGLITERIIGEEELVIKALDDKASTGLVAGASILGNGRVVLILDPLYLIKRGQKVKMQDAGCTI
jgi:two-component system chemotaxis sensor kinase CheA